GPSPRPTSVPKGPRQPHVNPTWPNPLPEAYEHAERCTLTPDGPPAVPKAHEHGKWPQNDTPTSPGPTSMPNRPHRPDVDATWPTPSLRPSSTLNGHDMAQSHHQGARAHQMHTMTPDGCQTTQPLATSPRGCQTAHDNARWTVPFPQSHEDTKRRTSARQRTHCP
ncbi:hypothetical protein PAXINDRAFT_77904, partial [Paxillus involutus ATCC 200175]